MLSHSQRSSCRLTLIARGWRRLARALAVCLAGALTAVATPASADPNITLESHIGNLGAEDALAGSIVLTNAGDPVKINSLTANGRCTLGIYGDDQLALSAYVSAGALAYVGLTDDQAPAAIAYAAKNNGKIVKADLTLSAGDQISIFVPALMPGADLLGFPMGGSCGNRLVSLKADTDAGELDWDLTQ